MNRNELRIFGILFLSIFSAVTGVGIVIPLLPVYARDLGASGLYISLIFGSFSISRNLFLPYFGRMSDKKGRRPFLVIGLLAYAFVSLGFMLTTSVDVLIALRFFQGIASAMIMPVAQAYVGDITPQGKEGFFMGLFSLAMFGSLSVGPLMGGFINDKLGLDAAFLVMGIFAVIAFFMCLLFLPPVSSEKSMTMKRPSQPWKVILSRRPMIGIYSYRFVYTTCVGVIWCFLPLLGDANFNLNSSSIGILVMMMVLVGGIINVPMGYLADKMNKHILVVAGGVFIVFSMVSVQWADDFWDLFVSVSLFGVGGGISLPAVSAIAVLEGKKMDSLGSVMSLLAMAHSFGMLVGSLIAGLTMDYMQLIHAFPLGAVIMGFGIVFFIVCSAGQKDFGIKDS